MLCEHELVAAGLARGISTIITRQKALEEVKDVLNFLLDNQDQATGKQTSEEASSVLEYLQRTTKTFGHQQRFAQNCNKTRVVYALEYLCFGLCYTLANYCQTAKKIVGSRSVCYFPMDTVFALYLLTV